MRFFTNPATIVLTAALSLAFMVSGAASQSIDLTYGDLKRGNGNSGNSGGDTRPFHL